MSRSEWFFEVFSLSCGSGRRGLHMHCIADPDQLRCRTKSTPLLLAASSGALSTLQCLIELGANILQCDQLGNNVIHLAALRCHANILEFFSAWQQSQINVWNVLVGQSRLLYTHAFVSHTLCTMSQLQRGQNTSFYVQRNSTERYVIFTTLFCSVL